MTPAMNDRLDRARGFVRAAMGLIREALGLKQVVQGGTLIGVGLLVMFAGEFTHYVVGGVMLLYGGYLIAGGKL